MAAKKTAKKAAKRVPRKAAPPPPSSSIWGILGLPSANQSVTAPLARDLGTYPVFNAYRNLINDHFGQVNLFEMGAMRDTPTDVAMADLFVRPALLKTHINPAEATPENLAAGLDLLTVLREEKHVIVLGDPGAGKSTLVNWLAYALANPRLKAVQQALGSLLPLPIVLRDVFHNAPPGKTTAPTAAALVDLFLMQHFTVPLRKGGEEHELLRLALKEGRTFLLLDGIDELLDHQRHWLQTAYYNFVCTYSSHSLLTSRVIGYESCPFHEFGEIGDTINPARLAEPGDTLLAHPDGFLNYGGDQQAGRGTLKDPGKVRIKVTTRHATVYYTAPFDDERLREFATRWYRLRSQSASKSMDTAEDFLGALQKSSSTHDLRRSPILLTYMAIVFRAGGHLPDGRSDLYGKIAEAFLETIPTRRKLEIPCHRQDAGTWLAHVAFQLQLRRAGQKDKPRSRAESRSAILIPEGELLALLAEAMEDHPPSPADPASGRTNDLTPRRLLDYLSQRAGLLLPRGRQDGGEAFAFTHLSFQEYFAAQYLNGRFTNYKELHDAGHLPPELELPALRAYIRDSRWAETFLLLFEILTLTPGPAIHPATLVGYLYAPENSETPVLNWFLHATYGKKDVILNLGADSPLALVLLCNLINDAYIQLGPLDEAPRHLLLHALANAVARCDQEDDEMATTQGSPAVQAFLTLRSRPSYPALFPLLCEAISKSGTTILNLGNTPVSDVTPLQSLTQLKTLYLSGTLVEDLTPLKSLTRLQALFLFSTEVGDVTPLQGLTCLQTLYLSNTKVSDLTPLQSLFRLQTLSVFGTQVTDLTPLQNLTGLESLFLGNIQVEDVTPLRDLTGLLSLSLADTQVSDITPLQGLTRLQRLDLDGNPVSDVTALKGLTGLQTLSLDRTKVMDLDALKSLLNLRGLYLSSSQVSDVRPLKSLTSLSWLILMYTPLRDVTPLHKLKESLRHLWLEGTPVSEDKTAMAALRKALPNTRIES